MTAPVGDPHLGVLAGPFLGEGFHAPSSTVTATVNSDDEWPSHQDTIADGRGTTRPFHLTERTTLTHQAPGPHPTAQAIRRSSTSAPRPTRMLVTRAGGKRPCERTPGTASSTSDSSAGSAKSPW